MQEQAHFLVRSSVIYHFLRRPSENMLIRANTDGTYSANWTPGAVGLYTIHVTIDGIEIGKQIGINPSNTIRNKGLVHILPFI